METNIPSLGGNHLFAFSYHHGYCHAMAMLWEKRLSAEVKTGSSIIQSALGKD